VREEVEYLLYSIDPKIKRTDGWLCVGNFMKFSAKFGTEEFRMNMFDEWSQGVWLDGAVASNYNAGEMPLGEWNGFNTNLKLDVGYLRHLARKTDWGRRRLAEFDNKSRLKSVLGKTKTDFRYEPQFGQYDMAKLVRQMCPPLLYDDKDTTANSGLFMFSEETGIWKAVTKNWVKRFIQNKVLHFMERQLIPSVAKRGKAIEEFIEDDEDLKHEHQYLMGVYKGDEDAKKLVSKGLIHKLKEQLSSLHNDAPQTNVANSLQSQCGFVANPYDLPEMWNSKEMNPHLEYIFPMKNGVIDLRTHEFRPATFDEMILHHTGRDYKPSTIDHKQKVLDALCEIYANDDQLMIKLITLSASLRGRNIFQAFNIEVGTSGNGKGTVEKFVKKTFGKLSGSLDKLAIQSRQKSASDARSDLAAVAHARIIFISEPDAMLPLIISTIKQYSGNDDVKARALYQDTFDIVGGLAQMFMTLAEAGDGAPHAFPGQPV
jgi:hypothetical protein